MEPYRITQATLVTYSGKRHLMEVQSEVFTKPLRIIKDKLFDTFCQMCRNNGEPYVLTEEDKLDWEVYMLKRQGNYTKANKLVAEAQGGTAATGLEKKEEAKKGEVMPETELPF